MSEKLEVTLSLKDKMSAILKNIAKTSANTSNTFKKNFANAIKSSNEQANKMLNTINKINKSIVGISGISIGTVLGVGLKDYISLDKQLAQTASTGNFDKLSEEYQTIEELSKKLGRETSKTATEVAEAMEKMYLAGWDTNEVTGIIEDMITFSIANNEDLVSVIDLMTDSTGATGLAVEDLAEFMDKLTRASTKANATVGELLQTTLKGGAGLSAVNTGLDEMIALQGILANSGFKGYEAGTALNSLSSRLYKSTGEGANGRNMLGVSIVDSDGSVKSFDVLMQDVANGIVGKSEAEIAEAFTLLFGDYKAQGIALVKSFSDMKENNEELTSKLMNVAAEFAEKEGIDIDLSALSKANSDFYELLDEIENNSAGAVATKYGIMADTLAQDLESLKSAFSGFSVAFATAFGENARPIIQKLSETLNNLSDNAEEVSQKIVANMKALFDFCKENKNTIVNMATAIGVFTGSFIGVAKISKGIQVLSEFSNTNKAFKGFTQLLNPLNQLKMVFGSIKSVFSSVLHPLNTINSILPLLKTGLKTLLNPIKMVSSAFNILKTVFLANPIAFVTMAIGLLALGFIKLYTSSETFRNKVNEVIGNVKEKFVDFGQKFMELYETKIKPCWDKIKACFVNGDGSVREIWEKLYTALIDILEFAIGWILDVLELFLGFFVGFATSIVEVFSGIINFFAGVFTGDWERAWDGLKTACNGFKDFFVNIWETIKATFSKVVDWISDGWKKIKGWFGGDNNINVEYTASTTPTRLTLSDIPQNALGTSYFTGGLTTINERGGELIGLPNGSSILPEDKTSALLENLGNNINININIDGNVIGEEKYIDRLGQEIATRVSNSIGNIA